MTFLQFCEAHGLIIRSLQVTNGKPRRVPTTCAPKERKGWYLYDGMRGTCGVWHGTENNAQVYKPGAVVNPMTPRELQRIAERAKAAELKIHEGYAKAAKRAQELLSAAEMAPHPYLARKGFPDMLAPCSPDGSTLYVTMYKAGKLVNLQRISETGEKRFLFGGDVIGAVHTIGDQGRALLCEGFATGLSVAAAIKASKMRAHCVVCFTAGNMIKVAERYPGGAIIADNDWHISGCSCEKCTTGRTGTGEKSAQKTKLRYWMPPDVDTDFNDFHRAKGLFAASMVVRGLALAK